MNQQIEWIPIKVREVTDEDRVKYPYVNYYFKWDCPIPNNDEEVLIMLTSDEIAMTTFYDDYFGDYEWEDIRAWARLPKPYIADKDLEQECIDVESRYVKLEDIESVLLDYLFRSHVQEVIERLNKRTIEVSEDMVSRKDFEDVVRRMGERNCFTCGMYREGEYIKMARNPEKVTAEELEEGDKPVSLAEVCKIIQDTYEVCPHTWQRLRELPSVLPKAKEGDWSLTLNDDYRCTACGLITSSYKANYCPNCGAKMKGADDESVDR